MYDLDASCLARRESLTLRVIRLRNNVGVSRISSFIFPFDSCLALYIPTGTSGLESRSCETIIVKETCACIIQPRGSCLLQENMF